MKKLSIIAIAITLTVFATFTFSQRQVETNQDCIGIIETHNDTLEIITDTLDTNNTNLLKKAELGKEAGGICMGSVFKVKKPIIVYRVWNKDYNQSAKGRWWTFDRPTGSLKDFREDYEVCCQWGPKNKMDACTLKLETKIVVGPGQSVKCTGQKNYGGTSCKDISYGISRKNQVYIDDPINNLIDCSSLDWPLK